MKKIRIVMLTVILALLCGLSLIACQTDITVTFDMQGGSGGTAKVTPVSGQLMPEATAPAKTGYTFEGYYETKDGEGKWYYDNDMNPKTTWSGKKSITVYAKWIANKYTVTLAKQGGSGGSATTTATMGQPMALATAPSRAGFTFVGYFDAETGGSKYYNADMSSAKIWDKPENAKLFAQWATILYTITLDADGGQGGTQSVQSTVDQLMPAATAPARAGYTFVGYFTGKNGRGIKYYNGDMSAVRDWTNAADGKLYAYWAPFTNGAGTQTTPFLISNKDELKTLAADTSDFAGLYFALANNINLGGEEWSPIGADSENGLAASFDGKGYTISNFKLTGTKYTGLFATVSGDIQNLKIDSFTITTTVGNVYAGGLIAYTTGNVLNCSATNGTVTSSGVTDGFIGMLIGESRGGNVTGCYAEGTGDINHITITGGSGGTRVGGLIGNNVNSVTTNCYASVSIEFLGSGSAPNAGGLIGRNEYGMVTGCYATGNISVNNGTGGVAGGLIGNNDNNIYRTGEIKNCYATGNISIISNGSGLGGNTAGGGFVGYDQQGKAVNCYATGNVTATDNGVNNIFVGGLFGYNNQTKLTGCLAVGNATATYTNGHIYFGGLSGLSRAIASDLIDCYRYVGQTVEITKAGSEFPQGQSIERCNDGTACTSAQLDSAAFYTGNLKWSLSIWDITDGKMPTLKA